MQNGVMPIFRKATEPFTTPLYLITMFNNESQYSTILRIPFINDFLQQLHPSSSMKTLELMLQEYQEQTNLFRTNIILSSPSHGNSLSLYTITWDSLSSPSCCQADQSNHHAKMTQWSEQYHH